MNKSDIENNLDFYFENPKCELNYKKDYELLLAVMLSAQTTDKRVNIVTDILFAENDSLEKLFNLEIGEIEQYIKTIGMYKTKAKNFKSIVNELNKIGYVPNDRKYLENLDGVGRKTTNVVLSELFKEQLIAVDTHVFRVSKRLGIACDDDNVLEVEDKLYKFFINSNLHKIGNQLLLFGRYYCKSRNPECDVCKFKKICKYNCKK